MSDEQVDGPAHYGGKDDPYEVIKVMIAHHGAGTTAAFCHLNAVKYLARAGKKGDVVAKTPEDLRKAAWYAAAAADLIEHGALSNR